MGGDTAAASNFKRTKLLSAVNGKKANTMEMESISGQMGVCRRENCRITNLTAILT